MNGRCGFCMGEISTGGKCGTLNCPGNQPVEYTAYYTDSTAPSTEMMQAEIDRLQSRLDAAAAPTGDLAARIAEMMDLLEQAVCPNAVARVPWLQHLHNINGDCQWCNRVRVLKGETG